MLRFRGKSWLAASWRAAAWRATAALAAGAVTAGVLAPGAAADMPGPSHDYPIVRIGDAGLPDHTILRPADLSAVDYKLPIVVWGNGGCRDSNEEFHYFLTHFAAYGYFIVADGPPQNPYNPGELTGLLKPQPQKLIAAINWALGQNSDPSSPYYQRLDPGRIVVMGQSCGGWETVDASSDPRVVTSIAWDCGQDPYNPDGVTKLHAPILYAYGGVSDYCNSDVLSTYAATSVPTVLADNTNAGHTGMWDNPTPPAQPPGPYQNDPLLVGYEWLAFTLYGAPTAKAFFFGTNCGLCQRPGWSVQSKGWGSYKGSPPPAPPPSTTAPSGGAQGHGHSTRHHRRHRHNKKRAHRKGGSGPSERQKGELCPEPRC